MANPWFRMYSEFASDPVAQSLSFDDQRHYLIILCLKCQGVLDRKLLPLNRTRIILRGLGLDDLVANEVRRRLMEVGFITDDWQPIAWNKRQFISDNSTERSRKSRNNKTSCNDDGTNPYVSVSESVSKVNNKKKKFTPPTEQEVIDYCVEKGYPRDLGVKVFGYYNEANWKDSTGKQVLNWKQKLIAVWFKPENKTNGTISKPKQSQRDKAIEAFQSQAD